MPVYDYIPPSDEGFRAWAVAFAANLVGDPAKYMLTPAQAASVQAAVDLFIAKLLVIENEATRTKPAIVAKDDAREAAEALCRQYAMIIKDSPGISDEDKVAAGVRPENPHREKVDVPQTSPLISIIGNTPGSQTLRFADTNTPDSRARPFGATDLLLFRAVADGPVLNPDQAKFLGKFTRNPINSEFTAEDNGKTATYFARWSSKRGELGPWSIPISFSIAA